MKGLSGAPISIGRVRTWVKNMKYCVLNHERDGTGYHEFYRGKWVGQSFWRDDSLYIDDYRLFEIKGFVGALRAAVPYYDSYGITEISREQWEK